MDPRSGSVLELLTDQPGMQVYTANGLNGSQIGLPERAYRQGDGIALEAQDLPNAVNQPSFPSPRLDPGREYHARIVMRLSVARRAREGTCAPGDRSAAHDRGPVRLHGARTSRVADDTILRRHDLILRPDPSRTVVRPFELAYPQGFGEAGRSRVRVIVDRVLSLDESTLEDELARVTLSLDQRHRDVDAMLLRRFGEIAAEVPDAAATSDARRKLIGAYFSEEYSFEAAALFNPSAVLHPDQAGLPEGAIRFILSLRGIGEGHVSSVTFRTGTWTPGGTIHVDPPSPTSVPPIIEGTDGDGAIVHLQCAGSRDISETVLFPILPRQRQGIEDMRLVRFTEEDGTIVYYGTYTAFDGRDARPELLQGFDLRSFTMRPLTGAAAGAKGMALFPRKVGSAYMMLGRQDSESIWLHRSDDLYAWEGGSKLVSPKYPWEFVQMGNCGSPIEIDEGWLVFTHGVGMVRNYCIGACLLDRDDPSKLLARTPRPILEPSPDERDGYVPNVVYSCGALVAGREVLLPYGVADNFATFATTSVDALLAVME